MPTYEYACLSCKRHFEVVQSFSDDPLRSCEVCGGPLRRVFHPVGIVLKGSGFYSTDNRGSRRTAAAEPKKETAAEPAAAKGSESSSTESTPAKPKAAKDPKAKKSS